VATSSTSVRAAETSEKMREFGMGASKFAGETPIQYPSCSLAERSLLAAFRR